ncbi:MAG TPA: hypothetical protein VN282_19475 [Pyrinomonadaceae bacterium]|nr:hypothetical protein [Pyrinomonadaceae bacterium]
METLTQTLSSQSFLQGVFLLLLTALLTGLLVPLIKSQIDQKRLLQQKQFEADLARQGQVIDAQVKLLEDLAQILWEYEFLALKVSYYKVKDESRYLKAVKEFDELSWQSFARIRAEISKSRRLTSKKTYQGLRELYKWMIGKDTELSTMIQNVKKTTLADWERRHDEFFTEGAWRIDNTLALLAEDLRLTSSRAEIKAEAPATDALPAAPARESLKP